MSEIFAWPNEAWVGVFFVYGILFGSFANVLIYRIPKNESPIKPRSYCYQCRTQIKWYDNLPIVSWFVLGGKCRQCKATISIRYPVVELLMGILFVLAFLSIGFKYFLIEALIFIFSLVVCSFIDFDHMILPDEFTLSGIIIGLLGALLNPEREFLPAVLGLLLGGGFLWMLAYIYFLISKKEGMGGGDIKLLAWVGTLIGWKAIPFVIMSSAITGSVIGIIVALRSKEGLKTAIPFGPYLALGAVVYILYFQKIADWYFNLFLPGF